jgi:hypothetical protein
VYDFINLKDENTKFLFLCYLVVAFVPDIPIAALILHGVQGTAKTTLLKIVKRLLDPSVVEVRGNVKSQEDFVLSAFRNRVLFFDNITTVPEWLSDAICRTVTGEGQEKRTLYTDEDTTFFEYVRVVGLAGINMVTNRPDLLDRSVILICSTAPSSFLLIQYLPKVEGMKNHFGRSLMKFVPKSLEACWTLYQKQWLSYQSYS